jgi:hypothetical protein
MSFKEYLISKRNIIIFLMVINSFALLVNVLEIRGKIDDPDCPEYLEHYILSDGNWSYAFSGYYGKNPYQRNFWPFVDFFEFSERSYYCGVGRKDRFSGFFRYFDYSEFFVYSVIMILGFYIRWESIRKK